MEKIRVAELFAGVGGFRVGLEGANKKLGSDVFEVAWFNQFEPASKIQHAYEIYVDRFHPEGRPEDDISNRSIFDVKAREVPEVEMLVGGFPCQDYSVATTLERSGGLEGKKGVLWWEIWRLLKEMSPRPTYLLLENVDRLLKSPASQRGRDFAVMLASLAELEYAVEWRVINAADYGMPQRRRRVFILGYLKGTPIHERLIHAPDPKDWLDHSGLFAGAFPVKNLEEPTGPLFRVRRNPSFELEGDRAEISRSFNSDGEWKRFDNTGVLIGRAVYTAQTIADFRGNRRTLRDCLVPDESAVPEHFFLKEEDLSKWAELKGAKAFERVSKKNGHVYRYSEGGIAFPDPLDKPSRTIVTGEGGRSPSRFKHVIETSRGLRRLMPEELEKLNTFEPGHTAGVPDARRAFLMGNALVTEIVQTLGICLAEQVRVLGEVKSPRKRRSISENNEARPGLGS